MEISHDSQIFSGDIDIQSQDYILKGVKNITTQSVISKQQLQSLHDYLSKKRGSGSVTITINDQVPLMLNNEEIGQLLNQLNQIIKQF
jgi:hypothetical protein